jgi:predicted peptidase
MGGGGVWWWGIDAPERFAGIAPVAGDAYNLPDQPGFPEMMCPLADEPIWVFHSVADQAAPFNRMIEIAAAVEDCGGEVRVLASRTLPHGGTWGWAYTDPDLYAWLLDPVQ